MIHQLRIYEIFPSNKDAFHDRFNDHAARIMRGYGFNILAMWETKTEKRLEFVYLLAWPDEATRRARWDAFMADEEWKAIKQETGKRYRESRRRDRGQDSHAHELLACPPQHVSGAGIIRESAACPHARQRAPRRGGGPPAAPSSRRRW